MDRYLYVIDKNIKVNDTVSKFDVVSANYLVNRIQDVSVVLQVTVPEEVKVVKLDDMRYRIMSDLMLKEMDPHFLIVNDKGEWIHNVTKTKYWLHKSRVLTKIS